MNLPESLAAYKFAVPESVVWGDLDAMNHVNNTQYFRYMETARIRFIREVIPQLGEASAHANIDQGLALAETRCRFKISLKYPDEILISAGVKEIQENQFLIQHEIYSAEYDCVAAEGDARMVFFDFAEKRKARIPADYMSSLKHFLVE